LVLRFIRELRFAHWEALHPLPRMQRQACKGAMGEHNMHWHAVQAQAGMDDVPRDPDLSAGLLQQKLQMLDCCIFMSRYPHAGFVTAAPVACHKPAAAVAESCDEAIAASLAGSSVAGEAQGSRAMCSSRQEEELSSLDAYEAAESAASSSEYASCCDDVPSQTELDLSSEADAALQSRRQSSAGASRPVQGRFQEGLLFPAIQLRLPPPVTSDMVAEREAALAALGEQDFPLPPQTALPARVAPGACTGVLP
jgi:hypothetical protein